MRWANINYLNMLYLIPFLIIFFLIIFRRKRKILYQFASQGVIEKLIPSVSFRRQYFKVSLIIIAIIFMIFSMARPQYGVKEELITQKGLDIILAIDTSESMNGEDIKPSRLDKVKIAVKDLITKLQGDRVGLVVFSGDSFLQCPLTVDYGAIDMFIDTLNTKTVPKPGTNIEKAVEVASKAFEAKERQYKVLIVMTDGENHQGSPVEMAKRVSEQGVVIYTIGIGSEQGAPIPVKDSNGKIVDTKKDRSGKEVISRLDESMLKEIAKTGKGKYFRVTGSGKELEDIYSEILNMEKRDIQSNLYSSYEDRFQYPLLIAFILLLWEFFSGERAKIKKKWSGRFE